ncbi:hypothetical protein ACWDAO_14820 [Streptomyces sp. NPDC001212]
MPSGEAGGSCGGELGALLTLAVAAGAGGLDLLLYAVLDRGEGLLDELLAGGVGHVRLHVLGGG